MKERILQLIEDEGLSSARFAEEIGIQRAAMTHIIKGRNNPSLDVVMKILKRFSYLSPEWLLFGTGDMQLKTGGKEPDLFSNTSIFVDKSTSDPKYRKEMKVNNPINVTKYSNTENVSMSEKASKVVAKIMIFYSDNTFDTFIPEKK